LARPSICHSSTTTYDRRSPIQPTRAGELYEARSDRERAASSYQRFLDLWRDADPELQPQVVEVRRRLAALTAERPSR
jgi:hypothetical protein